MVSRASDGDANSRIATCLFCGPLEFPAAAVTPERVREWMDCHVRTDSHKGMVRLAAELDTAIFSPPDTEGSEE